MDLDPFSEIVSLQCLLDPPDFLLSLEAFFNFRCIASKILSFFAFPLPSLDESFPHHDDMSWEKFAEKTHTNREKLWCKFTFDTTTMSMTQMYVK